jgi:hypothetical protein
MTVGLCRMEHRLWRAAIIALLGVLLAPGMVWSWGRIGHRVSARIAEARLTPIALASIANFAPMMITSGHK